MAPAFDSVAVILANWGQPAGGLCGHDRLTEAIIHSMADGLPIHDLRVCEYRKNRLAPSEVDDSGGRRTRVVSFFDFDYPEPTHGRNEFIVTTQMRVRRNNERAGGKTEDDERVVKPDLVLFVNGIPLVIMEAKGRWMWLSLTP